ncbi:hypothetical protein, partial [Staphylococcus pseudintermedius]|uniref:hypothetical protein n=1 Tax=Staphylococcus pseudintermedius TaxID=283734 RepID=UPI001A8EFC2D
ISTVWAIKKATAAQSLKNAYKNSTYQYMTINRCYFLSLFCFSPCCFFCSLSAISKNALYASLGDI